MPILQIVYQAPERNSHHIYMALIVLLILSEDDIFNKAVHEMVCFPNEYSQYFQPVFELQSIEFVFVISESEKFGLV